MPAAIPDEPLRGGASERVCRLLAGIDVGLAGGVILIAWLSFSSWTRGEFWWSSWNVAGAIFYGDAVFEMGLGRASLAGAALLLVVYSLLGGLYSLLARARGFAFNLLAALFLGLLWHLFADAFFWRRLHPFGPSYFQPLALLPGHLLYSLVLSRFAYRFRAAARALGDPAWALIYTHPSPVAELVQTEHHEEPSASSQEPPDGVGRDEADETGSAGEASRDC